MLVPLDAVRADDIQAKLAGALDVKAVGRAVRLAEAVLPTTVMKLLTRLVFMTVLHAAAPQFTVAVAGVVLDGIGKVDASAD
jgi:hypothetical protein